MAYTGSAITPVATYYVYDVDGNPVLDDDGKQVQAELPAEMYNASPSATGRTRSSPRSWTLTPTTVTVALSDAAKSNYVLSDGTFELTVRSTATSPTSTRPSGTPARSRRPTSSST